MKRRNFILSAIALSALGNPLMRHIFAEVPTGEDRRNMPLESKGLSIREGVEILQKGERGNVPPVLREEILENPDAVFIIYAGMRNGRDENGQWRPCSGQMEGFGRRVSELVFRKGDGRGGRTFIHPNMVGGLSAKNRAENAQGGIVSPYFTAGFAEGLRDMGNRNIGVGIRGGLRHPQVVESGLEALFRERDLPLIEAHTQYFKDYHRSELNWHNCPEGLIAKRFCTYRPVYDKGTTYINIAHAHTHWVAHTTLSVKNNQGVMPRGYGHICDDWPSLSLWRADLMKHFNEDYRPRIERLYVKHANAGFKHWDQGGYYRQYRNQGGYDAFLAAHKVYKQSRGDDRKKALEKLYTIADHRLFLTEIWAQRMMDVIAVLPPPYVSMVEGVYGNGADCGTVLCNFLTVGRNMFAVDKVTSWMMGHEPRELPFFRIAAERGLGGGDIENIPIFTLDEKGPVRVKDYRTLRRHPLGVSIYRLNQLGAQYF
ncbi:MAG: DUF362 domain-containing protein [Candidatus Latescibacterota bacterium]